MLDTFKHRMSLKTDIELLAIVNGLDDDYQPAALEAARIELELRNISADHVSVLDRQLAQEHNARLKRASTPLGTEYKALAMLFPILVMWIIGKNLKVQGYERKGKDLYRFTLYGYCMYVVLFTLIALTT